MARVEMVGQVSGTRDGIDWPKPGEVLATTEFEAADLIRAGLARAVVAKDAPIEKAVAPKAETRKGLTKDSI